MPTTAFDQTLDRYASGLTALEAASRPTAEQILEVLLARDAVQAALSARSPEASPNLPALLKLDNRLQKHASRIIHKMPLAAWRASLNPPPEAWWWSLEPLTSKRLGWLWSFIAILCLTTSIGLVVDITSRFSSGGLDTLGSFAIIIQGALTLVTAGGTLTESGQKAIERLLANLHIPQHYWQEVQLSMAAALVAGLVVFRLSLPQLAIYYNNLGVEHYRAGRLTSSLAAYNRALQLNPDYPEGHYNLGLLYEDLQDFDHARAEYQIAVQGGLDAAYNNLARLHIIDQNYSAAVSLLVKALELVQDNDSRYDVLKNLGWARLGQGRFTEAEVYLREAAALRNDHAPAHCLLAQVLEGQGKSQAALAEWDNCLQYASGNNSDEDTWVGMARQRFETRGAQP